MWEWLLTPIDLSREHHVGAALSWHARTMTLAWGVLAPTAIFVARYMKILPWQDWPRELDSTFWWAVHWKSQTLAYALSLLGLGLIWSASGELPSAPLHKAFGYTLLVLGTLQVASGYFRGSKGGPTDPRSDGSLHGDHYDMTCWRIAFEWVHRVAGYAALFLGGTTILSGLWAANAPRWMWGAILGYWLILVLAAVFAQSKGRAFDTYQAIWGADPTLPGNKISKMGWWTTRPGDHPDTKPGE
ncbi:MAG: cytochrome b561 domain-containing protein [Pseudomonadota bacterium]